MIIARNAYVVTMCIAGVAIGAYVRTNPALAQGSFPPYVWLLGVSFVFDLAMMAVARRWTVVPLQMNARVIGFMSGAALYLLIVYAFGTGAPVAQAAA